MKRAFALVKLSRILCPKLLPASPALSASALILLSSESIAFNSLSRASPVVLEFNKASYLALTSSRRFDSSFPKLVLRLANSSILEPNLVITSSGTIFSNFLL